MKIHPNIIQKQVSMANVKELCFATFLAEKTKNGEEKSREWHTWGSAHLPCQLWSKYHKIITPWLSRTK
jgi:hypothetical protein